MTDHQQLHDERRYDVPLVVIATDFTTDMLREWVAAELGPVKELARTKNDEYVDLPGGHWPQLTRPEALAAVLLAHIVA